MKVRFSAAALVVSIAFSAFSYVPQFGLNAIGDFGLVTLGKYTFSNPTVIDLSPTNAPVTNVSYSVRCQVIYVDGEVQSPKSELELEKLRLTGDWLTDVLKDFLSERYAGAEFDDLVRRYYEGDIGLDVDAQFPSYVRERMAEADLDIEVVKVQISAEDEFRNALISYWKSQQE